MLLLASEPKRSHKGGKMKLNRHALVAYAMATVLLFESAMLIGCGGSSHHTPSVSDVSQSVATAHTSGEMHSAYVAAVKLVAYDKAIVPGTNSTPVMPPEVLQGYEQLQLAEPESAYPTFAQAFATINDNPDLNGIKLHMTVDQVLANLNARLPAAYTDRTTSDSALLILLSSRPGAIAATAPVMTSTMKLSPLQRFVLPKVLAQLLASRGACETACDVAYFAALGLIGALVAECSAGTGFLGTALCIALGAAAKNAADQAHQACLDACHNQGGN